MFSHILRGSGKIEKFLLFQSGRAHTGMKFLILACICGTVCTTAIADLEDDHDPTTSQKLIAALMRKRGPDIVRPKRNAGEPVNVRFKMELYQVIELNERQQYVSVSAWVIERWYDEFLYWDPAKFDNITEVKMHHSHIWIPDTTLYNTLVMKDDDQRRLLYAKVSTEYEKRRSYVEFLYPAIYKFHCRLYLQFFPFDSQECHMLFGSWTSDNHDIDYHSLENSVGTTNFLPSEGWSLMGTAGIRTEVHYVCCPNNYTLMDFTLFLRRRPLFYLVNLVIPTFIITLIAITGFFTTSSTTGVREEKISLCITTLLSMSILMLMVSDQMPSTSTFIPLISWFYMCAIIIISVGALAASFVISVQKFGLLGERLPKRAVTITRFLSYISLTRIPVHLLQQKINVRSKHKKVEERSSTIAQFAKYIFTAGTEIPAYPHWSPYVQAYPNVRAVVPANGYANGSELLLNGADTATNNPTPSNPSSSETTSQSRSKKRLQSFSDLSFDDRSDRSGRYLAKIEYDWVATVIERCTFLVFLLAFLFVSLGINFVGFLHWTYSEPPPHAVRTSSPTL